MPQCELCRRKYPATGDSYAGLCPRCADETQIMMNYGASERQARDYLQDFPYPGMRPVDDGQT